MKVRKLVHMKNGLKGMLRQPMRCLFYIILSFLVAAYGAFGISLWDSADVMMKASDALYMTRVTVEGALADEVENLINSKYVIGSNKTVYGLGQMDGIENTALEEVENTAILAFQIVDIKDEKLAVESDILIKKITALENVCYPLELIGIPLKKAEEIAVAKLKEVGLREEQVRSYPANLSGGEQQRVAIARALAKGVKVILADEPTGNLDNENTELVIRLLQNLTKEGYCVIVVTHDDEVASEADVCLKMEEGKLQVS